MQSETPVWTEKIFNTIIDLVSKFGDILVSVAGVVVVIMIIIGGIQYITNQPDNGKKTIIAAIIGAIIVIFAYVIIKILSNTL